VLDFVAPLQVSPAPPRKYSRIIRKLFDIRAFVHQYSKQVFDIREKPTNGSSRNVPLPDRKVDIRLPGKGISNFHGARPAHQTISIIKWIQTRRLSMKNSLSDHVPLSNVNLAQMLTCASAHPRADSPSQKRCVQNRFAEVNSLTYPSTHSLLCLVMKLS
jgi:hypothetical protein